MAVSVVQCKFRPQANSRTLWPSEDDLRKIIKSGTAGYEIEAVKPGRSNEASRLIEAAVLKDDPRKLYLVGNAGTNTLAQTLVDLDESRSRKEMDRLCRKIIVFENGAQDNSGTWIARHYPHIAWHRSNHYVPVVDYRRAIIDVSQTR